MKNSDLNQVRLIAGWIVLGLFGMSCGKGSPGNQGAQPQPTQNKVSTDHPDEKAEEKVGEKHPEYPNANDIPPVKKDFDSVKAELEIEKISLECSFSQRCDERPEHGPIKDKDKDREKDRDRGHLDSRFSHCIAAATVCIGEKHCKSEMTIACNGHHVYSNDILHSSLNGSEYLVANLNESTLLLLMYPTLSCTLDNRFESSTVDSHLKIGELQFDGECKYEFTTDFKKPGAL